ncbi:UNVERIFIED_CONTAM: hypothetical protein DES50_10567 [Williamsia faeni]
MSYVCPPKLKLKTAARWAKELAPLLYIGEEIWAFARVAQNKPTTDGIAITNQRVIGFWSLASGANFVVFTASAREILKVDSPIHMRSPRLVATTAHGEVDFGSIRADEVGFVWHYVSHLLSATANIPSPSDVAVPPADVVPMSNSQPSSVQQRSRSRVFGGPIDERGWKSIRDNSGPDEEPWLIVHNYGGRLIAAFDDRILVSNIYPSSNLVDSPANATFTFLAIKRIEFIQGQRSDDLVVQTWGRHDAHDNDQLNRLSLPTGLRDIMLQNLHELRRRISDFDKPPVSLWKPPMAPRVVEPSTGSGLASELKKLADLFSQGLIDADEFKEAKRAIIAAHSG